jgi:hypothetical protein
MENDNIEKDLMKDAKSFLDIIAETYKITCRQTVEYYYNEYKKQRNHIIKSDKWYNEPYDESKPSITYRDKIINEDYENIRLMVYRLFQQCNISLQNIDEILDNSSYKKLS